MNLHDKRRAILARMKEEQAATAHLVPDDGVEADTIRREQRAERAQS